MVASTAFSARPGWSVFAGIRWSVSRGIGGQFAPESGGQYQRILQTDTQAPHTHKLSLIYQKTVEAMISNSHDDSLFQILVLDPLYNFVDHIGKIPGDFKEHFIKYDDNPQDDTVILFEVSRMTEMIALLEISVDFISDYYYMGADTHYLRSNVYQRMLDKADTAKKKARIEALYPRLAKKKNLQ